MHTSVERLHVFQGDRVIGRFDRAEHGAVLTYASDAPDTPISLSLPRDANAAPEVAMNYLENLLPENDHAREQWAKLRGVPNDTFSLLAAYGEDVAGAISLSTDEELTEREPSPLVEATSDEIAYQVARMHRDRDAVVNVPGVPMRMSLAGVQAKFSLARIGEAWYWSTYETPSTHILKPPSDTWKHVAMAEWQSLVLAAAVGIPSSRGAVLSFAGQQTFASKRWDRLNSHRLHAEDAIQALGLAPGDKYNTGAVAVAKLLAPHGQALPFVRQLAFNTALGNADAHGKNYSLLLAGDQVRLAPIYDTVPTILYPTLSTRLAMPIAGASHPGNVDRHRWARFAIEAGLDVDEVVGTAMPIMRETAKRLPDLVQNLGFDSNTLAQVRKHARTILRNTKEFASETEQPDIPAPAFEQGEPEAP